jgi:lipid-A-disaccharide synthase-like uncharacterized protein
VSRSIWAALIVAGTIGTIWGCLQLMERRNPAASKDAVNVKVQLDGARDHADLIQNSDGSHSYVLKRDDGASETLSPEEFAAKLYRQQRSRSFLSIIFNISHPIGMLWVSVGLLGQALFTGRMVVQWWVSERNRQSVVPPIFWWMSLVGSMMLLSYFVWRRDIVGILGQGFGLAIYLRNLHLIYLVKRAQPLDQTVDALVSK